MRHGGLRRSSGRRARRCFRSQKYSYERQVQYASEKSRKVNGPARLQYGKAHTLDSGFLPNSMYYDDAIEEWSSSSDGESDRGGLGLQARGPAAASQRLKSSGSDTIASAAALAGAGVLSSPTTPLELGINGSTTSGGAAAAAAAAAKGVAVPPAPEAAAGGAGEAAPCYTPDINANWPTRFVVLHAEGEAAAAANGAGCHQSQQPIPNAFIAAVAAAAALADPERDGAAGATQRAHMVLGGSSSNRRMSGAQSWLLRSHNSGGVAAVAASALAAAGGADSVGSAPLPDGAQRRRASIGAHRHIIPGNAGCDDDARGGAAGLMAQLLGSDGGDGVGDGGGGGGDGRSPALLGRGRSFINGYGRGPVDLSTGGGAEFGAGVAASALSFSGRRLGTHAQAHGTGAAAQRGVLHARQQRPARHRCARPCCRRADREPAATAATGAATGSAASSAKAGAARTRPLTQPEPPRRLHRSETHHRGPR